MNAFTRRLLAVLFLVCAVIAGGLIIEVLLSLRSGWPFGHTQSWHLVSWVGMAVILLVFGYPIKKRYGRGAGWPRGWFRVHQVAGIVGPALILVHSGPHLHAVIPVLAMVTMAVVAVSGVIGQAVHQKAVRLLKDTRRELLEQGASSGRGRRTAL